MRVRIFGVIVVLLIAGSVCVAFAQSPNPWWEHGKGDATQRQCDAACAGGF